MSATAYQTARADQVQAATSDARRVLNRAAERKGTTLHNHVTDTWLRAQAQALTDALHAGTIRACFHLAGSPDVGHAAVWRPGLIVCADCTPALTPTTEEDATCDRCRRHANPIHAGVMTVGPILLGYGLCRSCGTETGLVASEGGCRG
ncbi:MAG: hypothetical protein GEU94_11630 [Micromonosporaceae bacterium]|nr:hypothetical protein [Micromonosporaceae bacterium]